MSRYYRTSYPSYSLIFILLVFGIGIPTTSQVLAQERQESREVFPQSGAWALQFNVGQNFTLDSFLGSTISGKKHVSAARAWQAGLTLDASVRNREDGDQSETDDQERVALTVRYLSYPLLGEQKSEAVQLYMGVGPKLTFRRASRAQEQAGQEPSRTSLRWGVGVSGTVGAEWFVRPRISVSGAYETDLLFRRESIERSETEGESTETRFDLNSGAVRFGVSVYF